MDKSSKLEQAQKLLNDALDLAAKGNYQQVLQMLESGLDSMRPFMSDPKTIATVKPLFMQALTYKGWILEEIRKPAEAEQCYREASELGDKSATSKLEGCHRKRQAAQSTRIFARALPAGMNGVAEANRLSRKAHLIGSTRGNVSPVLAPYSNRGDSFPLASIPSVSSSSSPLSSIDDPTNIQRSTKENIFKANPVTRKQTNITEATGTQPRDTRQLAQIIIEEKNKDSKEYNSSCALALEIINLFGANRNKTQKLVDEVVVLATIDETDITTLLLEKFIYDISGNVLLKPISLEGLAEVINQTKLVQLDSENLIQVLNTLGARMSSMYIQDDVEKLEQILNSVCRLLNAMGDANVIEIGPDFLGMTESLQDFLNKYKNHPNKKLAYHASYAFQALLRISRDENKLQQILRRSMLTANSTFTVERKLKDFDPDNLFGVFQQFHKSAKFNNLKNSWYDELRYIELLLKSDQFLGFEYFVNKQNSCTEEMFCYGLLYLLKGILEKHDDLTTRVKVIQYIASLVDDIRIIKKHAEICAEILLVLVDFAQHHEIMIRNNARSELQRLSAHEKSTFLTIYRECVPDLAALEVRIQTIPEDFPVQLITQARKVQVDDSAEISSTEFELLQSVTGRLKLIRDYALNNADIATELNMYIPVRGATRIQDSVTFDLEDKIKEFESERQKILLLIGDAGSGKSTFIRFIEKKMWQEYKAGDPIPLFISLPNLNNPVGGMLNEAFESLGFNEKEIHYLKEKQRFFFLLDGYDEMNNQVNLYVLNQLHEWQAKTLISCRTTYLTSINDYSRLFAPILEEKLERDQLQEMTVIPFTPEQISSYIHKYLQLYPNAIWPTVEKYQRQIDAIRGLRELIGTPFLLKLTMDVLPRIVQKFGDRQDTNRDKILQSNLYDEFISKWFEREETKLRNQGKLPNDGSDVKDQFWEFAQALGAKMFEISATYITYIPQRLFLGTAKKGTHSSPWEDFFKTSDPEIYRARKACPLRKLDQNRYGFLHPTMTEYFATRKMAIETMGNDAFSPSKTVSEQARAQTP